MPDVVRAGLLATEASGILRTELLSPSPDRLIGNDDAALEQHLLDEPQAQRKPEVQPDRMGDDLGREPMALVADGLGHAAVITSEALIKSYRDITSQTSRFGMDKRLCLGHRTPPVTGWLCAAAEQCSPFDPAPLQNLPLYYELLRPCAPHRYSDPCGSRRSDVSLRIGATGSHVPYKSLIRLRAAYMPDVARAVFRTAPELIPGAGRPPGFDITFGISTRHQRFACARLSGSHLTGSGPAFCCNAHHHRS